MGEEMFTSLHPLIQQVLLARKWKATPIQEITIPALLGGNGLVIAPTGSGKTMAAMLPILDRCLKEGWKGLSILYITPLRALNRDVDRRLEELVKEVGLTVGIRHGDTSQSERQKQVRAPPSVLITTPETFQLMFTGSRLRELLMTVKTVIIDEIHEIVGSERGWQLSVGLSRLELMQKKSIQRLGLSATIGNPKQVANWLGPNCVVLSVMSHRETLLTVESISYTPSDEIGATELSITSRAYSTLRGLSEIVLSEPPCLIFVNSRNNAETVAQRLSMISPELCVGVHHGSLAKETRQDMEDSLRTGKLQALVCTSSLELGIDVGSVNRIIQIRSPRSVDRMLQRVGRADHRLGGLGRGHVLGWDVDDISESSVISRRAMKGEIEDLEWRNRPYSVAANQIIMMAYSFGAVPLDEVTNVFQGTSQFSDWKVEDTVDVAKVLAEKWVIKLCQKPETISWYEWPKSVWEHLIETSEGEFPDRPKFDQIESMSEELKALKFPIPPRFKYGWISQSSRTREWVSSHLSMIPDKRSYRVRDSVTRRLLGNVDEAFVLSLNDSGEEADGNQRRFVMAGRTWMIVDADPEQTELLVSPVLDIGHAPHWVGELPPTPASISQEVGRLRRLVAQDLGLFEFEKNKKESPSMFQNEKTLLLDYPMDEECRGILAEKLHNHFDLTGSIPSDKLITIERRDEAIVVNSCNGSKINEALGHFLLAMASTRSGKWGRLITEPTRISLQVVDVSIDDVVFWMTNTPATALENILSVTLPNSREVRWRFAQVAKTFGILKQGVDPRKINLQALLKRYKGSIVMKEVLGKLFHERLDIAGASDILASIKKGFIEVRVTSAGPLGVSERNEKDLLLPNWNNVQVQEQLKHRLRNERAVLCCLMCYSIRRFRVARYLEMDSPDRCIKCKGWMLACSRESYENQLLESVKSDEKKNRDRIQKNAEIVKQRGIDAILALMGRGIGETTCQRIMRKVKKNDHANLLEAIYLAEIEYARTRRFWG